MRGFPWVKLRTSEIEKLGELRGYELKVFLQMVKAAEHGGFVYLKQGQLQKRAKVSQGSVAKALKQLASEGLIENRGDYYRINPRYVEVGRKTYKPKVPGLIDVSTGEVKRFKVKQPDNAANVYHP